MEIQVGEYVKSTDGFIAKIEEIDEDFINFDSPIIIGYDGLCSYFGRDQLHFIAKHSFDIRKLIEEGDYVNGQKVVGVSSGWIDTKEDIIRKDHIKSIVTHEQMEAMEYEVK